MKIINQPREDVIGEKLKDILNNVSVNGFNLFYIMVSYVKKSGVIRLKPYIDNFRGDGGEVKAIAGIDQKNTSFQGLSKLFPICDELYVYHSENLTQTFHPKVYAFEKKDEKAIVFIGSNNLTAGGLYTNYEISSFYEYDLTLSEDAAEFSKIKSIFESYSDTSSSLCKKLTTELIEQLNSEGYLSDENKEIRELFSSKSSRDRERIKIFGSEVFRPPPIEEPQVEVVREDEESGYEVTGISPTNEGFWKKLSHNDVSKTSSPGQIVIPKKFVDFLPPFIDWETEHNGARQSDVFFDIIFIDSLNHRTRINGARSIYYIPAPTHPRINHEIRFTFRNKEIRGLLECDDILEFRKTDNLDVEFIIHLIKVGTPEYGRFGTKRFDSL